MTRATLLVFLTLVSTLDAAPPRLRCSTIDGTQIEGELIDVNGNGDFSLSIGGERKVMSQEDLTQIVPVGKAGPTSRPAFGFEILLANGDRLAAELENESPSLADSLTANIGMEQPVRIPIAAIAAVRFDASNRKNDKEFDDRVKTRVSGRDVLMLVRDGKLTPLPGALDALSKSTCSFRVNDKVRSIPIREAYGVILGSVPGNSNSAPAVIVLHEGSRISAKIMGGNLDQLRFDAGLLGDVEVPWSRISRIDFQSGRVVFLSDLQPDIRETTGLTGATWPVNLDKSTGGGPLSVRSRTFAKGIGVHADAAISYKIDGQFERLTAIVGVNDSVAPAGSVVFRVKIDGRTQFESPVLRGTDEPLQISVDIRGGQRLTLEADMADDLDISDHADWGKAVLIRKK